ncbi:MAG TPA: glycosyltransferase family A protein [Cellulomonas sp.]
MTAPLVSVVVPALDPGPALGDALACLVAQTVGDWEAIVVDDGSSEDLGWVAHVDPRVTLVSLEHVGVSGARNVGVERAQGRWVAFLDHDDTWRPAKLERQLAVLAGRPEVDLCHTAFTWVIEAPEGDRRVLDRRYAADLTYQALLRGEMVCTSTAVLRKDAFLAAGGFAPQLRHAEDLDLWLRMLASGSRFAVLDEPLAVYTSRESGASGDYEDTYRARRALLLRHLRLARRAGDDGAVAAARAGLRRGRELASAQAFDAGRRSRGAARVLHVKRALVRDPGFVVSSLVARSPWSTVVRTG